MQFGSVNVNYLVGYGYASRFRLDHVRIYQLDQIDDYCGAGSGTTITIFRPYNFIFPGRQLQNDS